MVLKQPPARAFPTDDYSFCLRVPIDMPELTAIEFGSGGNLAYVQRVLLFAGDYLRTVLT